MPPAASSISQLPDEILHPILAELGRADLQSACLVSRRFTAIARPVLFSSLMVVSNRMGAKDATAVDGLLERDRTLARSVVKLNWHTAMGRSVLNPTTISRMASVRDFSLVLMQDHQAFHILYKAGTNVSGVDLVTAVAQLPLKKLHILYRSAPAWCQNEYNKSLTVECFKQFCNLTELVFIEVFRVLDFRAINDITINSIHTLKTVQLSVQNLATDSDDPAGLFLFHDQQPSFEQLTTLSIHYRNIEWTDVGYESYPRFRRQAHLLHPDALPNLRHLHAHWVFIQCIASAGLRCLAKIQELGIQIPSARSSLPHGMSIEILVRAFDTCPVKMGNLAALHLHTACQEYRDRGAVREFFLACSRLWGQTLRVWSTDCLALDIVDFLVAMIPVAPLPHIRQLFVPTPWTTQLYDSEAVLETNGEETWVLKMANQMPSLEHVYFCPRGEIFTPESHWKILRDDTDVHDPANGSVSLQRCDPEDARELDIYVWHRLVGPKKQPLRFDLSDLDIEPSGTG